MYVCVYIYTQYVSVSAWVCINGKEGMHASCECECFGFGNPGGFCGIGVGGCDTCMGPKMLAILLTFLWKTSTKLSTNKCSYQNSFPESVLHHPACPTKRMCGSFDLPKALQRDDDSRNDAIFKQTVVLHPPETQSASVNTAEIHNCQLRPRHVPCAKFLRRHWVSTSIVVVFRMYRDVFWLLRISWTHQACVMPATPHPSEND